MVRLSRTSVIISIGATVVVSTSRMITMVAVVAVVMMELCGIWVIGVRMRNCVER